MSETEKQHGHGNGKVREGHPFIPLKPLEEVLEEFHEFNKSHKSVVLGTVNKEGFAETSYAPCLQKDNKFYIYISELAVHTPNIMNTLKASLLYIAPEDKAGQNLFKRQRSTIKVNASAIERGTEQFDAIMDNYAENFGKIMRNLSQSKDFHLFELTPEGGNYVRGFGQAYRINGEKLDQISHMGDRGHGKSKLNTDGTEKQEAS